MAKKTANAALRTVTITIDNCMACPHHVVIADPDPFDVSCSDDQALVCKRKVNDSDGSSSLYQVDLQMFFPVLRSCAPDQLQSRALIPAWCPLVAAQ